MYYTDYRTHLFYVFYCISVNSNSKKEKENDVCLCNSNYAKKNTLAQYT